MAGLGNVKRGFAVAALTLSCGVAFGNLTYAQESSRSLFPFRFADGAQAVEACGRFANPAEVAMAASGAAVIIRSRTGGDTGVPAAHVATLLKDADPNVPVGSRRQTAVVSDDGRRLVAATGVVGQRGTYEPGFIHCVFVRDRAGGPLSLIQVVIHAP